MPKTKGTPGISDVYKQASKHMLSHTPNLVKFYNARDRMLDLRIPVREPGETFSPEVQEEYDVAMKQLVDIKNEIYRLYTTLVFDWAELKKYEPFITKGAYRDAIVFYLNKHQENMDEVDLVVDSLFKLKMRLT